MKLSDYVINYLADLGVKHVFLITGGAVINLVDSFRKNKNIDYVCVQNEQAGAMAAEAYSRITKNIGAAMATSGPGATNLITGICCAYFDSIPAIYITGQVNTFESKGERGVRQVGFQETDIVSMVKSVTKYAVLVDKPEEIKFHLEKAVYLARTGRPGPVLLDIPMNIQRAEIDPDALNGFTPNEQIIESENIDEKIDKIINLIQHSKKPILIFGYGVRAADAINEAKELVNKLKFPFSLSWAGMDMFGHDHELFAGSFGVSASRFGNFAVQTADLIISIGTRLDTRMTGGKPETFAPKAKKIIVDIDQSEIDKKRGLVPDISVVCDAKIFLQRFNQKLKPFKIQDVSGWMNKINEWKDRFPVCLPEYEGQDSPINIYCFMKILSEESGNHDVIITDAGGNLTWTMQGFPVKAGQRLFSAFGHSPMGYSLPAAIGASFALGKKPVTCIIGDGGIQINIQELQTIFHYQLPIKIFVINNDSYGIIKQFQDVWMEGRYEATCPETGCSFPDFVKVGRAYGLETETISRFRDAREKIKKILSSPGPVLCDVKIPKDQKIAPKLEFGRPLEDAAPLLDRDEFNNIMNLEIDG